MDPSIHRTIFRMVFGIGCLGCSYWAATTGYRELQLSLMVSSVPLFVLGILILWQPLVALLTRPLTAMIDSLFFPGGKLEKPPLNLKLPAYLVNEGRYTEALEEYERILKHYPDEVEAYEKAIWLCQDIFQQSDKAQHLLHKAEKRHLVLDDRVTRLVATKPGSGNL